MIFRSRSQLASKQIRRTGRAEAVEQHALPHQVAAQQPRTRFQVVERDSGVDSSLLAAHREEDVADGRAGPHHGLADGGVLKAEHPADGTVRDHPRRSPSDTAALVTFTVRDADGEVLAIEDLMLPPNWHDAQNMPPLFDLSSFTGSLEITSTEPIISLSLNFEAAAQTSEVLAVWTSKISI